VLWRNKRSKLEAKAFHLHSAILLHHLSIKLGFLTISILLHFHSQYVFQFSLLSTKHIQMQERVKPRIIEKEKEKGEEFIE
jgi:hypothetical protein